MIKLLDDDSIAFSSGGETQIISHRDSIEALAAGDPTARLELIAWGMLAAYREQTSKLDAKMAEVADRAPRVEDVLSLVTQKLPEILKGLSVQNPPTNVRVTPRNGGATPDGGS